jgi:uncharacterized glyoxalase superfamily protein PhnB
MRPVDLVRKLRREEAIEPAALDRAKAVLLAAMRREAAPRHGPRIVPQVPYLDLHAALAFLQRAFGFREVEGQRIVTANGVLVHAMLELGGGVVGIGEQGGHGAVSPQSGGSESQYISVYVDDVEAHHRRAVAAGARIANDLRDFFWGDEGHRTYEALDPEGHRWRFHQMLRREP